ncbi:hypothetical protein L7F22_020040 [Adiantum nelumboides]|nr:hypothetical protein [Adiantum nelumboides]
MAAASAARRTIKSSSKSPDTITKEARSSRQGLAKEALDCFQSMQQEDISPDAITFVNVLNACSHSGLVDDGQVYFDNMKEKYGIAPDKEHYTCMVDLFGRARLFDKAMRVIKMMPSSDYPPVWSALLGACRKWGNVKLGKFAFERAVQLDERNAAAYHSEKLAIACAIINTPQGKDIRITKNMRVCGDCHAATSVISKLEKRKIMVKDASCLHIFEGGKCSCGDYQ